MKCERCQSETKVHTVSYFNTQAICGRCEKIEQRHPTYPAAKKAEMTQVIKGNYNYEGVGLPNDLK
jgi:7-cyano-7-deazaguanine synthase in queuosine biosynthesis